MRRNVLKHLMPPAKKKKHSRKVELPGPPLDIATSREIDLGPVIVSDFTGSLFFNLSNLLVDQESYKNIIHIRTGDRPSYLVQSFLSLH